jgi:hypothetical protein
MLRQQIFLVSPYMTLRQYLEWKKMTTGDFAKLINVSQQSVVGYGLGRNIPRREIVLDIEKVTEGAVSPADWYRNS